METCGMAERTLSLFSLNIHGHMGKFLENTVILLSQDPWKHGVLLREGSHYFVTRSMENGELLRALSLYCVKIHGNMGNGCENTVIILCQDPWKPGEWLREHCHYFVSRSMDTWGIAGRTLSLFCLNIHGHMGYCWDNTVIIFLSRSVDTWGNAERTLSLFCLNIHGHMGYWWENTVIILSKYPWTHGVLLR